jgi:hypothetical protein
VNTGVTSRSDVEPSDSRVSRAAVTCFLVLFAVGTAAGLVQWLDDTDTTSTGAGVAVANVVHCLIAAIAIGLVIIVHRRHPARLRAFARSPFTAAGWRNLLSATIAVPRWFVDIGRAVSSRQSPRRPFGRLLLGLPAGIVLTVAAILIWYTPVRAGLQVFAALDPDFTRDAWGGPSYLGASLAHWMDGVLMFYAATALIAALLRWRRGADD